MDKELKIIPPEGYEVDMEHSTFECIKFKPIKPQLPKTWEEFCEQNPIKPGECSVGSGVYSNITKNTWECHRNQYTKTNVLPSLEYAKAILALCQLIQLRDCYNDGWEPDWTIVQRKYCLVVFQNKITKQTLFGENKIMSFKSEELRDKFLENFKDLIEIAKPLL